MKLLVYVMRLRELYLIFSTCVCGFCKLSAINATYGGGCPNLCKCVFVVLNKQKSDIIALVSSSVQDGKIARTTVVWKICHSTSVGPKK